MIHSGTSIGSGCKPDTPRNELNSDASIPGDPKKSEHDNGNNSNEMKHGKDKNDCQKKDAEEKKDSDGNEQQDNTVHDNTVHSSANTVNSSTTSQTSSSGSRKSRRSSVRSMGLSFFRPYDPMHVVSLEQLEAFSLLLSTPVWIFDFIKRKNRYSNPAGLDLWSAPSLDEFLNRNMNDMSAASVVRTQEIQNRIEKAQVVQDMWTFYPKGKARTLQITIRAVRLSPDEDHCSILVVGNMTTVSTGMNTMPSRNSITLGSIATGNIGSTMTQAIATSDSTKESGTFTTEREKNDDEAKKDLDTTATSSTPTTTVTEESMIGTQDAKEMSESRIVGAVERKEEKEEVGEEMMDHHDDETIPLNHILDSDPNDICNQNNMATLDEDDPINQEILRGVEIIRHLPMAVCQFDMKGRVMFQNPAAYLPPLDEDEEKDCDDDTSFVDDGMDTDDESEYYEQLFEQQYGGVQTLGSGNGRGNFMDRFVNKKVARELLESLQDKPKKKRENGTDSRHSTTSIDATFNALNNTTTITIEAELHTSTKGRTQWSAIQLRKTKDPVTSRSVILYSAQDKSDAMEAKREREARLQKSEFLAIMAHEIRTPLHQVTGFIDLLELDACTAPITTTTSSGAINISTKSNGYSGHEAGLPNAVFPTTPLDGTGMNSLGRTSIVRKVRSATMMNSRGPRTSSWSSPSMPRQSTGNFTFEQRNYIKLLKSSANQLMTVISDVLDYSKLEAGKMKIERIPFELLSVLQGSMEAVRGSCEEKGLHLTLEYGGSDDDVYSEDEVESVSGENGIDDRRGRFRRRRSLSFNNGTSNMRPPRRRRMGKTHSFKEKKTLSHNNPQIKTNDIPFRILGDPNRLRQVLLNLLSNAVKFTDKGGIHVRVSSSTKPCVPPEKAAAEKAQRRMSTSSTFVERKEEGKAQGSSEAKGKADEARDRPRSIRIIVSDTGMGISKEQQDTIFEKYQQANLSVARNFGGTGLGLSICKLLVEETMGGWISVDSDEDRGSSFCITLPIELPRDCDDDTSQGVNGGDDNKEDYASMNILVAEDNKINQKLVANMLKRMGHTAVLVENGRQAIDMIVKNHSKVKCSNSGCSPKCIGYDAVLMDIQMPVMDGLEATRRLRTMGYTNLPILGLTASVKRSDYIELGFNDWLPKPILMKDLKAKLLKLQTDKIEHNHSEDSDESSRTTCKPYCT